MKRFWMFAALAILALAALALVALVILFTAPAAAQVDPLQNCDGKCRSEYLTRTCALVKGRMIPHDANDIVRLAKMNEREFQQAINVECMPPASKQAPKQEPQKLVSQRQYDDDDNGYQNGYKRGRRVTDPRILRRYGVSKSICYGKPNGHRFSRPVAGGGTAWYTCP